LLFKVFINDIDDGPEHTLSKFSEDTKLGGVVDFPAGHAAIQRDLNRPEKRVNTNLIQFNKKKHKSLQMGRKNPIHQYMLWATQLESN